MKKKSLIGTISSIVALLAGAAVLATGKPEGKNLENVLLADAHIPKIERSAEIPKALPLPKKKNYSLDKINETEKSKINFSEETSKTDKYGNIIITTTEFYEDGKTPKRILEKTTPPEGEDKPIREKNFRRDGTLKKIAIDRDGDGNLEEYREYDELERVVKKEDYRDSDILGLVTTTKEIGYWVNTKKIKSLKRTEDFDEGWNSVIEEFSEDGKKTYREYDSNTDREVHEWVDGKICYRLHYSKFNDGKVGYAEETYEYNEDDKVIRKQIFKESKDLRAIIEYGYSPKGDVASIYSKDNLNVPFRVTINTRGGSTYLRINRDTGKINRQSGLNATKRDWEGEHYKYVIGKFLEGSDDFREEPYIPSWSEPTISSSG